MGNTYIELLNELKEKRLIAFGCGNFFNKFLLRYPALIEKIDFIIDNNYKQEKYIFENIKIPVYRPNKLKDTKISNYVVIFFADRWREMQVQLNNIIGKDYLSFRYPFEVDYMKNKEMGYYHRIVVPIMEELEKNECMGDVLELLHLDSKENLLEELTVKKIISIPRMPVILTPKCSLRCKECNNLMWKFEIFEDLSTETIIASLKHIISCMDFLPNIELIGGEPFAAKNLKEVLDFLITEPKVLNIEITTNATILPKEDVIESLKSSKVVVRISDYSMVVNQDKFIKCMKVHGINYTKLLFENWTATGGIKKRNRDASELIKQYYSCGSGYLCKTLWENKVYPCARAASLAELNIYKECPYVDVLKTEKLRERLIQFYLAPTCGPCDFCNSALEEVEYVEPAIQMKKDKSSILGE